jgi:hypothetical protein
LSQRYFYLISEDKRVPGILSNLLSVSEEDLVEIFKVCGFHNKKGSFQKADFKMWVWANFERRSVKIKLFHRKDIIKIVLGEHPSCPMDQWEEELDLPRFQMLTVCAEGEPSRDSLMHLFSKEAQTTEVTTTEVTMATYCLLTS